MRGIIASVAYCGMMGGVGHAAPTASFEVAATIAPGCSVDGAAHGDDISAGEIGTIDFGRDITLSTATRNATLLGNQTITLRCTPGIALQMALGGGQNEENGLRHMQLGSSVTDRLHYRLYSDAGMTTEIGINQQHAIIVTTDNMNNVQLPVYGRLQLTGNGAAGVYTDNMLVTLSW